MRLTIKLCIFENINKESIKNLLPYSKNVKDKLK